jgi:hypothetical protein
MSEIDGNLTGDHSAPAEDAGAQTPTIFTNPFVVESPEKLQPRQLVDLFVPEYTEIETVKQRKHTFIWGSRGSGKSMMLRYLEPGCQMLARNPNGSFFQNRDAFFAVYCPFKEGQFNKTELKLLNEFALLIISEHMVNLSIAGRLVNSLLTQFSKDMFSLDESVLFARRVLRLFDKASITGSLDETNESISFDSQPLRWLRKLFKVEIRKVNEYLKKNAMFGGSVIYEGATSGYHDFLLPLMKLVQEISALNSAPVYLLLDDAGKLTPAQQSIINTWVANRDQATLCLKISALRAEYETFLTRDGGLIEQPHDYSEVNVEELYTQSGEDYAKKVKLIANRRLELSPVVTKDIEVFLPPDPAEESLLQEFKKQTAEEWKREGQPGRQKDFINRYATARLFQHLRAAKKRKSYAGFQNMVHLSSGVVRDFLEPCYLMFDSYLSQGVDVREIKFIPPSLQNEVLFAYSEELLLEKLEDIKKNLPAERWTQVDKLRNLVESLGRLFFERLHDPEAREARLFSFTVRGRVSPEIEDVLRLGVRHRYFQLRTYSTKEGGGREPWYILNRRLCPVYKLDQTGFEGRISLTPAFIELACEDPEQFVRLRLKQADGQSDQFTLF